MFNSLGLFTIAVHLWSFFTATHGTDSFTLPPSFSHPEASKFSGDEYDLLAAVEIPFQDPKTQYIDGDGHDGFPAIGFKIGSEIKIAYRQILPEILPEEFSILVSVKPKIRRGGFIFAVVNSHETVVELGVKLTSEGTSSTVISIFYSDHSQINSQGVANFTVPRINGKWARFAFRLTLDTVTLFFNCNETQTVPIKREPMELIFDSASTLYIAQAGSLIGERYEGAIDQLKMFTSLLMAADQCKTDFQGFTDDPDTENEIYGGEKNDFEESSTKDFENSNSDSDFGFIPPPPPLPEGNKDCCSSQKESCCNSFPVQAANLNLRGEKGDRGSKGPPGESIRGPPGPPGPPGQPGGKAECSCNLTREFLDTFSYGKEGPQGIRGLPGPTGEKGFIGPQGFKGEKGDRGLQGAIGIRGFKGEPGLDGIPGLQGPAGPPGPPGPVEFGNSDESPVPPGPARQTLPGSKGEPGITGPVGPRGEKGNAGTKGQKGDFGSKGERGDRGLPGEKGPHGSKGHQGEPGLDGIPGKPGLRGDKGDTGAQGTPGLPGPPGVSFKSNESSSVAPAISGPKGEKGDPGPRGDKGDRGDAGEPGNIGPMGEKGATGSDGIMGPVGAPGNKGERGDKGPPGDVVVVENSGKPIAVKGEKGAPGRRGRRGRVGLQGPPGPPGKSAGMGDGFTVKPGPTGPPGVPGPKGEKGDLGPVVEKAVIKGEKGDSGTPGRDGLPGPPGSRSSDLFATGNLKYIPGPPGAPGPPGLPGITVVGPKGEPGVSYYEADKMYNLRPGRATASPPIYGKTEFSPNNNNNDGSKIKVVPGAIRFEDKSALIRMTSISPVGTIAYLVEEEAVLVRVNNGWQYLAMGSFLSVTHKEDSQNTFKEKPPFEADNLIHHVFHQSPSNIQQLPKKTKMLRLAALNEPHAGHDFQDVRGADYACYRQSRRAGLRTTFRALIVSHLQNLDSIVRRSDRKLPLSNLNGEILFNSWSDIFAENGAFLIQPPRILSFGGSNVLTDSNFPRKAVWHGALSDGRRSYETSCDFWQTDSEEKMGFATSLLNGSKLLEQTKYECNKKLIVLCVEVMPDEYVARNRRDLSEDRYQSEDHIMLDVLEYQKYLENLE